MASPHHPSKSLTAPLCRLDNLATMPWQVQASRPQGQAIIVPLDGSMASEHALPFALAIALRSGMQVKLMHVVTPSLPQCSAVSWWGGHMRLPSSRRMHAKRSYLANVSERIYEQYGVEVVNRLVAGTDLASALHHEVMDGDLVVMARRRKSWWNRALTSNVVNTAAQRLSCPMLIVPGDDVRMNLTDDPLPDNIIVGLDGYAVAERILASATFLARLCQAKMTLLHVRSDYPSFAIDNPAYYLNDLAQSLGSDLQVRTCVVSANGRAVTRILQDVVHEFDKGLLALSGSPSERFLRLVQPSVLDNMIAKLPQPLLLQACEPY